MIKGYARFHGLVSSRAILRAAPDLMWNSSWSSSMRIILSTPRGTSYFFKSACPSSLCSDAKENTRRGSLGIINCTLPSQKLHSPSNKMTFPNPITPQFSLYLQFITTVGMLTCLNQRTTCLSASLLLPPNPQTRNSHL